MRSLSLDAAFFDGLSLQQGGAGSGGVAGHKRSGSMDGPNSTFEGESAVGRAAGLRQEGGARREARGARAPRPQARKKDSGEPAVGSDV